MLPVVLFVLVPPRSAAEEERVSDIAVTPQGQLQITAPELEAAVGDEFIISGSKFDSEFTADGSYHVAAVSSIPSR